MCNIKLFYTKYFLCVISLSTGTNFILAMSILGHGMVLVSVATQLLILKDRNSDQLPKLLTALLMNITSLGIDIFAIYGKLKDKLMMMTPFMALQAISMIVTLLSLVAVPVFLISTKFPAGVILVSFLILVAMSALQYHFTSVVFSYYRERKIILLSEESGPLLQPSTA